MSWPSRRRAQRAKASAARKIGTCRTTYAATNPRSPAIVDRFHRPCSMTATSQPATGATYRTLGRRVVTAIPNPTPVAMVNSGWANGPKTQRSTKVAARPSDAGVGERPAEVEHVLGEGEADAGHPGVDDAVDDPVELAPPVEEDEEHGQALGRLLHDRGDHVAPTVTSPPEALSRAIEVELTRMATSVATAAPQPNANSSTPGRLGLEPVEPEQGGHDDEDGDRGQRQSDQHAGRSGVRADDGQDHQAGRQEHRGQQGGEQQPQHPGPSRPRRRRRWGPGCRPRCRLNPPVVRRGHGAGGYRPRILRKTRPRKEMRRARQWSTAAVARAVAPQDQT